MGQQERGKRFNASLTSWGTRLGNENRTAANEDGKCDNGGLPVESHNGEQEDSQHGYLKRGLRLL